MNAANRSRDAPLDGTLAHLWPQIVATADYTRY